ncbi:MAG: HEAT repeat domain-containing protein [Acidobacteriota bacterium]
MQELIQQVLNKEPAAALTARRIGAGANAELIKLTEHSDAKVRRIALYCLDETGGADAVEAFSRSILDEDPQVQAAALKGLEHHANPSVYYALLEAYDRSSSIAVRRQIMLILGRMPGPGVVTDLKKRYAAETEAEAREGGLTALARLEDREARQEFIKQLQSSTGQARGRFLEYCKYVHAPWLLKALQPILEDKTPLVWIGVDAHPDWPEQLRACDIAVNLAASISRHKFTFPIAGNVNYSEAQLEEVRSFLSAAP